MYVCEKCHVAYQEKPNGRCPACGGLVRKNLDKTQRERGNRKRFQNARKMKRGDWEND
jgi:rRNA maturation endonuclease Nob1